MKTKLRILVDDCIPFIRGVLEPVADVHYLSAADFTPDAVATADALIVRTRTRCDAALLAASSVRFVATATIGFDHIDVDFCRDKGIAWTNAAGCNATSVAQYVASALSAWAQRAHIDLCSKTLGVVGVGHVGSAVCDVAKLLGIKVLCNDPLRSEPDFVSLDEVAAQSEWIGEVLDLIDPFPGAYTLEVSSPGLSRPLRRPHEFYGKYVSYAEKGCRQHSCLHQLFKICSRG